MNVPTIGLQLTQQHTSHSVRPPCRTAFRPLCRVTCLMSLARYLSRKLDNARWFSSRCCDRVCHRTSLVARRVAADVPLVAWQIEGDAFFLRCRWHKCCLLCKVIMPYVQMCGRALANKQLNVHPERHKRVTSDVTSKDFAYSHISERTSHRLC